MLKRTFLIFLITSMVLITGCTTASNTQNAESNEGNIEWMKIELKDIRTQETYKISDFKGKQVFLETFSVYCSSCEDQQEQLRQIQGEDVISISINTDPAETEENIIKHIEKNNFTWKYSVAPEELTLALLDEFGYIITQSAHAPIVMICEDGSYSLLPTGVKKAADLKEALELGC